MTHPLSTRTLPGALLIASALCATVGDAQEEGRRRTRASDPQPPGAVTSDEPGRLIAQARLHIRRRAYGPAIQLLEKAVRVARSTSDRRRAYMQLMDVYRRQGDEEKFEAYRRLLYPPRPVWASSQTLRRVPDLTDQKRYDDAQKIIDAYAKATSSSLLRMRAEYAARLHRAQEGLPAYARALEASLTGGPQDVPTLFILAKIYTETSPDEADPVRAVPVLERLAALAPGETHYLTSLVHAYMAAGRPDKVLALADTALERSSSLDAAICTHLAIHHSKMGQPDKAVQWAQRCGRGSESEYTLQYRAEIYQRIRMPDRALAAWQRALDASTSSRRRQDMLLAMVELLAKEGRFRAAREHLERIPAEGELSSSQRNRYEAFNRWIRGVDAGRKLPAATPAWGRREQ